MEHALDRGACGATAPGVTKSQKHLSNWTHTHNHSGYWELEKWLVKNEQDVQMYFFLINFYLDSYMKPPFGWYRKSILRALPTVTKGSK